MADCSTVGVGDSQRAGREGRFPARWPGAIDRRSDSLARRRGFAVAREVCRARAPVPAGVAALAGNTLVPTGMIWLRPMLFEFDHALVRDPAPTVVDGLTTQSGPRPQ